MKKILFAVILLTSTQAHAVWFNIVGSSFSDTAATQLGCYSYVDLAINGTYVPSDHLKIYISHEETNGSTTNLVKLLDSLVYPWYITMASNPDGSKRVYFNMPTSYDDGKFQICVNLGMPAKGFFDLTTSINYITSTPDNTPETYYDLLGQPISPDTYKGLYIVKKGDKTTKKFNL